MEKMSEADKQKLTQQIMAQAMKQTAPRPIEETPEVLDAMRVVSEVNSMISAGKRSDEDFLKYKLAHQNRISKLMSDISAEFGNEMAKMGTATSAGGVCRAAFAKKGASTMALIGQEYPTLRDEWEKEVALWKARLAPLAEPLRKANYGIDANDPSIKQALGQAQSLILGTFQRLLGDEAAVWAQGADTYGSGLMAAAVK
jgi:hypothetical protein